MTERYEWDFGSKVGIVLTNVSEYDPFRAFYELTKNSEEAGASAVHMDFDFDHRRIVVYDDGDGMSVEKLNSLSKGIGRSEKDLKHHGVGLMGFMRISKKMVIFSKQEGCAHPNILSCTILNDKIVSDTGGPREATREDKMQYVFAVNKLNKCSHGTVIVLEGVGEYQTPHYDFHFDFKEVFDRRRFEGFFRKEADFKLKKFSYYTKFGNEKPKKLAAKLGQGKPIKFSVPSKQHTFLNAQGQPRNIFLLGENNEHAYELRVEFDLWISSSHEGEGGIYISEGKQNNLEIFQAVKGCFKVHPRNSIYTGHEFHKYLRGLINFKIKPLNGAPDINVYSGSRTQLLMGGPFGDALANILQYAEIEVLRPAVSEYVSKKDSQKDEISSREVQEDIEAMVRQHPDFFNDLVSTTSTDVVSTRNDVTCPSCHTTGIPIRGKFSTQTTMENEKIYAFEDNEVYVCGHCGRHWPRKKRTLLPEDQRKTPEKPVYHKPLEGESKNRQKRHGFGFTFVIRPFGSDPRRTRIIGTTIEISSSHDNYKCIKRLKGSFGYRLLKIYERQQAMQTIVEYESENLTKVDAIKKLREGDNLVLIWYNVEKPLNVGSSAAYDIQENGRFTVEDLKQKFAKEA